MIAHGVPLAWSFFALCCPGSVFCALCYVCMISAMQCVCSFLVCMSAGMPAGMSSQAACVSVCVCVCAGSVCVCVRVFV